MEDIIAITVKDRIRGRGAFITWGRVFDPVDTDVLKERFATAIKKRYGFHNVETIHVCNSLRDVAGYPYFFECLAKMSWKPIPFGTKYRAWAAKKRREISAGKEIYFLGLCDSKTA